MTLSKTSTWWVDREMDSWEINELINDDIRNQESEGYQLVGTNAVSVDRRAIVILVYRKNAIG